jgi:hypothetical protein
MKPIIIVAAFFISGLAKAQYFHEVQTSIDDTQRNSIEKFNTLLRPAVKNSNGNPRINQSARATNNELFSKPSDKVPHSNLKDQEQIPAILVEKSIDGGTPMLHLHHPEWNEGKVRQATLPEEQPHDFTFMKLELHEEKNTNH